MSEPNSALPRAGEPHSWQRTQPSQPPSIIVTRRANVAPSVLLTLPAIEILRQIWIQNFMVTDGNVSWRENDNIPPTGR